MTAAGFLSLLARDDRTIQRWSGVSQAAEPGHKSLLSALGAPDRRQHAIIERCRCACVLRDDAERRQWPVVPAAGVSDRCHHVMNDAEVHACCVTHTELSQWPLLPALGVFRSSPACDDQTMQRWSGV